MALQQDATPIHWNYFLALEDDLYRLARYIEFSETNYGTYSIEIARLLMSASAEADSVLKQLAVKLGAVNARNILDYFGPVTSLSSRFIPFNVTMPRFGLTLRPWSDWTAQQPPHWWSANNQVKHHRHSEFKKANLQHCLNAMAGLMIAVLHLHSDEGRDGKLVGLPKLFTVPPEIGGGQSWGPLGHCQNFYLRDEDNPYLRNLPPPTPPGG